MDRHSESRCSWVVRQAQTRAPCEIDEGAWSVLDSITSRSYLKRGTGSIAVTVINHYGDEVSRCIPSSRSDCPMGVGKDPDE